MRRQAGAQTATIGGVADELARRHGSPMSRRERLWDRYLGIRDQHRNGLYTPILWHLALRQDPEAMALLGHTFECAGRIADPFSQSGLCYRAYRKGNPLAAQHLAMNAFNRGDLVRYRHWLRKAERAGDVDAGRELRRFEVRLPHENATLVRRRRPYRRYDFD